MAREFCLRAAAAILFCAALLHGPQLMAADTAATKSAAPPSNSWWPQFRGPGSTGRASGSEKLPAELGPEQNVIWKVETPAGHSSPVVIENHIFLTAVRDEKLFTLALARDTGKLLWEREAPHKGLEKVHGTGSHAQPTPATDGERVVSFFGSSGLYCYDLTGKLLWSIPMGPFNNDFGAGSSPIIEEDWVILCQDHDTNSFLTKINKHTGERVWTTDRSEFPRNYCTPVIWRNGDKKQIVVAATLRVVGYDFDSGEELWTVRGISRAVCMTPVVGDDGNLYVAGWAMGGDADERIDVEPFDTVAPTIDGNKNGVVEKSEIPDGHPYDNRFSQVDRDKDGQLTRREWEYFRSLFDEGRNLVLAIRPGGVGDITASHVAWEYAKFVPFCASPLYVNGLVFTVKDGGILNCLNAKTGKPYKQQRLAATDEYYSSPVAGDGKLYLMNQPGKLTVVSAERDWEVLSTSDLGEEIYATPAIVAGRIYLRTVGHLYCFGLGAN